MEINIYKTYEIDDYLWNSIADGFNQSFEAHPVTTNDLRLQYRSNTYGYSFHAVCTDGEKVVGFNTIAPYIYKHNGENVLLGLSGSTFVIKEYRNDIFIFHDMYQALKAYCVKENMISFLGVPNENSYMYSIKFLKCKEIFTLSYYILPLNISRIIGKKNIFLVNFTSKIYALLVILLNGLAKTIWNSKERSVPYQISLENSFHSSRLASNYYKNIIKKNIKIWYRVVDENGIKTAYIMDFRQKDEKTLKALWFAVWSIFWKEKADVIMYVGTMNLKQAILTKVPAKFEPKRLPLTYNLLKINDPKIYKDIENPKNWDFSLLNLDVK